VTLIDKLLEHINYLKTKNRKLISNVFLPQDELNAFLHSKNTNVIFDENIIMILKEEEALIRFYFYATTNEALKRIREYIRIGKPTKPLVTDIIGREFDIDKTKIMLNGMGFSLHRKLIRMTMRNTKRYPCENSNIVYASLRDASYIKDVLYSEFDVLVSHLPSMDDIYKSIDNHEISLAKQGSDIAGLSYFKDVGKRQKYLYQIVVLEMYRGQGIADDLLVNSFNSSKEDVQYQLWAVDEYFRAIKKYKKYNFKEDGLVDYIMVYK